MEMVKNSGFEVEVIEYLKTPPSVGELAKICRWLEKEPVELIRIKERLFKELGLSKNDERPNEEWLKVMAENPSLIERPIVSRQNKFALGRPLENIERLLDIA